MKTAAPRLWRSLRTRLLGGFIATLLGAALFFTIEVERTRRSLRHTGEGAFATGAAVTVVAAIDGDEFSVADVEGNRTVVRLVGLKAFAPDRNDYVTRQYGQRAFQALKGLVGKPVKLTLGDPTVDSKRRLLAHADVAPEGAEGYDVAERLISDGLAMAYVRYPHAREDTYLAAETRAQRANRGLWGDEAAVQRAQALKALWQEQRE